MAIVEVCSSNLLLLQTSHEKSGARYYVALKDCPPVYFQRPAVDVLFQSVSRNSGKYAICVLLSGMGSNGARGLLEIRRTGAYTLAQDEESCVVYGMPRAAIDLDAAECVAPLSDITPRIFNHLHIR